MYTRRVNTPYTHIVNIRHVYTPYTRRVVRASCTHARLSRDPLYPPGRRFSPDPDLPKMPCLSAFTVAPRTEGDGRSNSPRRSRESGRDGVGYTARGDVRTLPWLLLCARPSNLVRVWAPDRALGLVTRPCRLRHDGVDGRTPRRGSRPNLLLRSLFDSRAALGTRSRGPFAVLSPLPVVKASNGPRCSGGLDWTAPCRGGEVKW